jgi:hypothetical protein
MSVNDQSAIPVGGADQTVKRPRPELSIDDFVGQNLIADVDRRLPVGVGSH